MHMNIDNAFCVQYGTDSYALFAAPSELLGFMAQHAKRHKISSHACRWKIAV